MDYWPIFDIFHRLRPYLCSKRDILGFYKQAKHNRRPGDEPFFTLGSTVHDWEWPKNGPFWTKKAKHGRLAPDSTKASGKALMGHSTSICMGIHALGSFTSLATPKMAENWPKLSLFWPKKPSMAGLFLTQQNKMMLWWWIMDLTMAEKGPNMALF